MKIQKKNPVDLQDVRTEETKRTCGLLCNVLAENSNKYLPPIQSFGHLRLFQNSVRVLTVKKNVLTLRVLNSLFFKSTGTMHT